MTAEGFIITSDFHPESSPFMDELHNLCIKHGVAIIHQEKHILLRNAYEAGKLAEILYVAPGRMGWAPRTKER